MMTVYFQILVQYRNESPLKQKKKFDIYEMPNFEKLNNIYDQRQQKLSKPIGYLFFSKSFMTFAFVSIHRKRCYRIKKCLSCREIVLNTYFLIPFFFIKEVFKEWEWMVFCAEWKLKQVLAKLTLIFQWEEYMMDCWNQQVVFTIKGFLVATLLLNEPEIVRTFIGIQRKAKL